MHNNNSIKSLNLSGNQLEDQSILMLAKVLSSGRSSVTCLNLSSNQCTNKGALALADALKPHKRHLLPMKYLDLSNNLI